MTMLRTVNSPASVSIVEKKQTRVQQFIQKAAFWAAVAALASFGAGNAFAANVKVACHGADATAAINNAITSANGSGGGIVELSGGVCLSRSVHLKSNVTLQIDAGSTLRGANRV